MGVFLKARLARVLVGVSCEYSNRVYWFCVRYLCVCCRVVFCVCPSVHLSGGVCLYVFVRVCACVRVAPGREPPPRPRGSRTRTATTPTRLSHANRQHAHMAPAQSPGCRRRSFTNLDAADAFGFCKKGFQGWPPASVVNPQVGTTLGDAPRHWPIVAPVRVSIHIPSNFKTFDCGTAP